MENRNCAYCGVEYTPKDPNQRFCSRSHRKQAAKRRICPHPEKIKYRSEAIAIAICEMNGWTNQRPYPCRCGAWHTSSKAKRNADC